MSCLILIVRSVLILPPEGHPSTVLCRTTKTTPQVLEQRLFSKPDAGITEPIQNILFPLDSQSQKPKDSDKDSAPLVKSDLCSPFPGLILPTQSTALAETTQLKIAGNGSGKARAVGVDDSKDPVPRPEFVDGTGTSGSLKPSPVVQPGSSTEPTGIDTGRTQIDRSTVLSSVERIRNNFIKLQTKFILPTKLDHYGLPTDDHDETVGSVGVIE